MKNNDSEVTISNLSNYFPLGRYLVFEKINVEDVVTSSEIILKTHNTKNKVIKVGKEVPEELLGNYILFGDRSPIQEIFSEDNKRYYQIDSAYVIGREFITKRVAKV